MNKELMQETLDYIRMNPKEWNQKDYFCDTTMCYAGTGLYLAGKTKVSEWTGERCAAGDYFSSAQILFGLNYRQAYEIFYSFTNDFQELENVVKSVMEEG